MAEQGATVRVLLLARAGEARQRLEAALAEAGAELVAAVDPVDGDSAAAIALAPAAVLVALEPSIEDSLERYDSLLSDPGVLVMFDEAEVAAQRDGWDAARWVRHLAAKLNGHEDVLPPGADADDAIHPAPGPLPEREFDPASVDIGALTGAAHDLAAEVPRAEAFDPPLAGEADAPAAGFAGLVSVEDMDWSSSSEAYEAPLAEDPDLVRLIASADEARSLNAGADDMHAAAGIDGAEAVDADAASVSDAFELDISDEWSAGDVPGGVADDDAAVVAGGEDDAPPAIDPLSLGDGLSLADDDAPIATRAPDAPAIDLDALASRLDGLSLADPDSYGHGVLRGAVVVEAGLGGPDAVRQLIGGLDAGFARAVLVRLQLDGGRYERLVQQMQRATSLPVALAEPGGSAEPGTVYFLAPDTVVVQDRARMVFATAEDDGDSYGALPAADSAVIFLSGAQVARVDEAMALATAGALVLAQAPDSCYDSTAVGALVGRGADAAQPGDLATALLDRWPA
ncbi:MULTISPECIES: chemotaxis protein CheB [unclassified Luteimonas]